MQVEQPILTQQANILALEVALENAEKRCEEYKEAYDRLQHYVSLLLRNQYGKKSERFIDANNGQLSLFPVETQTTPVTEEEREAETVVAAHTRKKKKTKSTADLPRVIEIIEVPHDERHCDCGCEKKVIRYESKELLDYTPAKLQILEQRREVLACPNACVNAMRTAKAPLHILPKVKATENLLASVIVSKLHHRQPLYHLEKYGDVAGLSRETLSRWVIALTEPLMPIFNLLKDEVIDYDIASLDGTTLQVLNEPNKLPETQSQLFCLRGGPPEKQVVLYGYTDTDYQSFLDQWLEGFQGTVHMDAHSSFNLLLADPKVKPSFCNAHSRRKFEAVKQQAKKQGLAHEALRFYKGLYRIEREAKEKHLTREQRYPLRQEKSKPLWDEFKQWLDQHVQHVLPQSPLGKAFQYCLKRWDDLGCFLTDGRLEIDNNLTEQEIKPFVIARKNFMFATSVKGAHALALHFSLIRTAIAHKLNPYQYYVAILKRIPHCQNTADFEALLPWNIELV